MSPNVIKHSGTDVMMLTLASSDQWCDPKSMIIAFDIQNMGDEPLEFLSTDMQVIFSSLVVRMGSVVVEDHTQNFNRLTTLLKNINQVTRSSRRAR